MELSVLLTLRDKLSSNMDKASRSVHGMTEHVEKQNGALKKLANAGKTVFKAIAAGALAASVAVGGFAAASANTFMQFDDSMRQVQATMGITAAANAEQVQMLTEAAKESGKATKFSASQAAEALNYLALAGYDAEKAVATMPKVLNLAAAGGLDLAYASDLVTDSMAALGLGTEQLDEYIDKMAKSSQKSNTSVAQLGEATLVAAGQARLANMPLTDLNTALGILADNGIKGSEGGTAMRNVLKNLTTPTAQASKMMEKLGLSVYDAKGQMRPLQDVLTDLNKSMAGMSDEAKSSAMGGIFDTRTIAAASALLKDSGDRWNELAIEIDLANDASQQMADTMEGGLGGSMRTLKSALEGLQIEFADTFTNSLGSTVKIATGYLNQLTDAFSLGGKIEGYKAVDNLSKKIEEQKAVVDSAKESLTEFSQGLNLDKDLKQINALKNEYKEVASDKNFGRNSNEALKLKKQYDDLTATYRKNSDQLKDLTDQLDAAETELKAMQGATNGDTLMGSVFGAINNIVSDVIEKIANVLPKALSLGSELLITLVTGIAKNMPAVTKAAVDVGLKLLDTLLGLVPMFLSAGFDILIGLADGISSALPTLIPTALQAVITFARSIISNAPNLLKAGLNLISSLVDGIFKALPKLITEVPKLIREWMSAVISNSSMLISAGLSLVKSLMDGIKQNLPLIVTAAVETIEALINGIISQASVLADGAISLVMGIANGLMQNLNPIINGAIKIVKALLNGIVQSIPLLVDGAISLMMGIADGLIQNLEPIIKGAIKIVDSLVNGLIRSIPLLLKGAMQLVLGLAQGLIKNLPLLINAALDLISSLANALVDNINLLIDVAVELVQGLLDGLLINLPILINGAITLIMSLVQGLINNIPLLAAAAINLIQGLVNGLILNIPQLINGALQLVSGLVDGLIQNLPLLVAAAIQLVLALIQGLISMLPTLIISAVQLVVSIAMGILQNLPVIITAAIKLVIALGLGLIQAIPQLIQMVPQIIMAIIDTILNTNWPEVGIQIIVGIIKGLFSMITGIFDAVKQLVDGVIGWFKNLFGCGDDGGAETTKEIGRATGQGLKEGMEDSTADVESASQGLAGAAYNNLLPDTSQITGMGSNIGSSYALGISNNTDAVSGAAGSLVNSTYVGLLPDTSQISGIGAGVGTAYAAGIQGNAGEALNAANSLASGIEQAGSANVNVNFNDVDTTALQEAIPVLEEFKATGSETFRTLTAEIQAFVVVIQSVSLYSDGQNIIFGLIIGIESKEAELIATAKRIANCLSSTFSSALDIHSPSRVMEGLGEYTTEGVIVGVQKPQERLERVSYELGTAVVDKTNRGVQYEPYDYSDLDSAQASYSSYYDNSSNTTNTTNGGEKHIYIKLGNIIGNVSVQNEADEDRLADKIIERFAYLIEEASENMGLVVETV